MSAKFKGRAKKTWMLHSQSEKWTYQICFVQLTLVSMTVKGVLINCGGFFGINCTSNCSTAGKRESCVFNFLGDRYLVCYICVDNEESPFVDKGASSGVTKAILVVVRQSILFFLSILSAIYFKRTSQILFITWWLVHRSKQLAGKIDRFWLARPSRNFKQAWFPKRLTYNFALKSGHVEITPSYKLWSVWHWMEP